jgi:hypothetical protein
MDKDQDLLLDVKLLQDQPELLVYQQNNSWGGQARKAYKTASRMIVNQLNRKKLVMMTWPLEGPTCKAPSKDLKIYKLSTCYLATNVKVNLAQLVHQMLDPTSSPRNQNQQTQQILETSVYKTSKTSKPRKTSAEKQEDAEMELGDHMALDDSGQKKQEWWKLKREKVKPEDGNDDCGEDLSGLGEVPATLPESAFPDFEDSFHPLDAHVAIETQHLQDLPTNFLHGSDIDEGKQVYHSNLNNPMTLEQMETAFLTKPGRVDIVEIFGGA